MWVSDTSFLRNDDTISAIALLPVASRCVYYVYVLHSACNQLRRSIPSHSVREAPTGTKRDV